MIDFSCIRCGRCCSNLISDVDGKMIGLYLNIEEVKYFPTEKVAPLLYKDGKVKAYQVITNKCPNLEISDDKKCSCKIYDNRPLGCKTFPLKEDGVDENLCTFMQTFRGYVDRESLIKEKEALEMQKQEVII